MTSSAAGFDFSQFVPGFDFFQHMSQQPTHGMPMLAQWMTPTLDPKEIERRIQELKLVQFWLEQNTTALKASIQALEMQLLTANTLQRMNEGLGEVAASMSAAAQSMAAMSPSAPQPQAADDSTQADAAPAPATPPAGDNADSSAAMPDLNQAMAQAGQWWGGLLHTFQSIAQQAAAAPCPQPGHDTQASASTAAPETAPAPSPAATTATAGAPSNAPKKRAVASKQSSSPRASKPDAPAQQA